MARKPAPLAPPTQFRMASRLTGKAIPASARWVHSFSNKTSAGLSEIRTGKARQ